MTVQYFIKANICAQSLVVCESCKDFLSRW